MVAAAGGGAAVGRAYKPRKRYEGPDDDDGEGAPAPSFARRSKSEKREYKFSWLARKLRQEEARQLYTNAKVQWFIAFLIMGNFFTNIVEKQIDPSGTIYAPEWLVIENIWNSIFVVELAWNMFAHWGCSTWKGHFLSSGWNLFDFLVVSVSVPSMLGIDLGPGLSQLRMLRAFRVFRLFKRIKSLNKIIVSLANAVPGLVNAAIVQFLVMCIYAILAVDLFKDYAETGEYVNINEETVPLLTARGMTYGYEYYGNFFRSLFTLFQVLTGESWSEAVARPVIMAQGVWPYVGGIYFVSYIIICGIILVNVAVAVLLEKMVDIPNKEDEDEDDPGIKLAELPEHAATILSVLDTDGDGVLSSKELSHAAELLQREALLKKSPGDDPQAQAAEMARQLKEATEKGFSQTISSTQGDIAALREESKAARAMESERHRTQERKEQELQRQMLMLVEGMSAMRETMAQQAALQAARPKRKPPPGHTGGRRVIANGSAGSANAAQGDSSSINGCGANGGDDGAGGTRTPVSAATMQEEDRVQDGVRTVSKQAPERVQQRL